MQTEIQINQEDESWYYDERTQLLIKVLQEKVEEISEGWILGRYTGNASVAERDSGRAGGYLDALNAIYDLVTVEENDESEQTENMH